MAELTKDEISRRCQDLVYKVAYSFYDSPYIILLRILTHHNVITEKKLGEMLGVGPNDVRKYLGQLHVDRLIKRHVNKEKVALTSFQQRQIASGAQLTGGGRDGMTKSRDVIYWYLDYRGFADVVKYRIAMMRKAIDEKIKNEVGKRGYLCPNCLRTYETLEVSRLFDPSMGGFACEVCGTELVEDDPALHDDGGQNVGQDRMQRFNVATAPIRDALKGIEGANLPTININAWIALNVKDAAAVAEAAAAGERRRVDVVIDAEDDSEARAKEAEAQRVQNALPVWIAESTVTNEATTLGMKQAAADAKAAAEAEHRKAKAAEQTEDFDALEAHYAAIDEVRPEDEDEEDDVEVDTAEPSGEATPNTTATTPAADVTVMVNGEPVPLADITEEHEGLMSTEEYEAYYEAMSANM
ncbi:Transcription initiation factor IIE subunit alpha [Vanrija pseudolonga]|uniref:Transcription initiation factor IIE subunit alpha n=1 Tax=Vanrija pseudolonga TaxID=143232 RepID=A0AAF0YD01_9TREE|nr:Transcription initiation factor IIE subunit alpha [Vanrija pseudolonga]